MTKVSGFTLLELMIVVVIVSILTAIALPAYNSQMAKGRRSEAVTALMQSQQALERYFSANGTYSSPAGANAVPANIIQATVPNTGGAAYYNINAVVTDTTFTLTATRAGIMGSDPCGNFIIDQTGAQSLASATYTTDQCWRQ